MSIIHYVKNKRRGALVIEQDVVERLRTWKRGRILLEEKDRIINITGWPGIGKSSLLRWIVEEHEAILIDLEERAKYPTYKKYVNSIRKSLERGPDLILCLDHVPGAAGSDDYLEELEEELLVPLLEEENAFFVMAQQDPRSWCWTKLPHLPPMELGCFNQKGTEDLLKKTGRKELVRLTEIFWYSDGHPLLALKLLKSLEETGDYERGMREFLDYWVKRAMPPGLDLNRLWKVAKPLSVIADTVALNDRGVIKRVLSACRVNERSGAALNLLRGIRWVEDRPYGPEKRFAPQWVEPVRACLEYIFKKEDPGRWEEAKKAV